MSIYRLLSLILSAGKFCYLGATAWPIQITTIPLEELSQSRWSLAALCIYGDGFAWMHTL